MIFPIYIISLCRCESAHFNFLNFCIMFCYNPDPPRFARVVVRPDELVTQNNLAFDLKDMDELRERGVPISNSSLENSFYDGEDMGDVDNFNISPDLVRGVDINDMWELSKESRKQLTKAQIKSTDFNPK